MTTDQENEKHSSFDIYTINKIKFTPRELDVISCIIHGRGEKKIALLLAISPRTVGTHVHNIMLKIGCSSKERIIDFIEKSSSFFAVKNYYLRLLLESSYREHSSKIEKLAKEKNITCFLNKNLENTKNKILLRIIKDLSSLNIKIQYDYKNSNHTTYGTAVISFKNINHTHTDETNIILLFENNTGIYPDKKAIDFTNEDDYYSKLFIIITKLINEKDIIKISDEFNKECSFIKHHSEKHIIKNHSELEKKNTISNKNNILAFFFIILVSGLTVSFASKNFFSNEDYSNNLMITSDLILPHKNILLNRDYILTQIDKKLSKKEGINTVALVGIGGSGKTSIARQYARNQKIPVVWEVKADTRENILFSFEQLAYLFCRTEEEKREVSIIQKMLDEPEKERKLLLFITKAIKKYPEWLMIYNDVVTFKDIRKYFPYDPEVWGNGKVIITTRDSNIVNNSYILEENVINVGHLSEDEKFKLFTDITEGNNNKLNDHQKLSIGQFLSEIPPFPLDVSLAAYYIKEEKISYDIYLQHIYNTNNDFISLQKAILSDIGEYTKTRYDILTLSIEHVINSNRDFSDLLLFTTLINFDHIPKKLLIDYKGYAIFSSFLHELRKFSFIIEEEEKSNNINSNDFSIHDSTKEMLLGYLLKKTGLDKTSKLIQDLISLMNNYADLELKNPTKKKSVESQHIEEFLKNYYNLPGASLPLELTVKLGEYYFDISNYRKAMEWLEKAYNEHVNFYGTNDKKTSKVAVKLATVYRNVGDYKNAKKPLEQAYNFFKSNYGEDNIETTWAAIYLGSVYRNIGDYKNAKYLLEKAMIVYRKHFGNESIKSAWVSIYLGSLYKNIGNYKKAKELLELSLKIYKNNLSPENIRIAWISTRIAGLYNSMGYFKEAKELASKAIFIYKKYYGERCIETAWATALLGNIYKNTGNYEKAEELIKKSIQIYLEVSPDNKVNITWVNSLLGNLYASIGEYKKAEDLLISSYDFYKSYNGDNNVITASVLIELSRLYVSSNELDKAKIFLDKAIKILSEDNHTDIYICYEIYSDLYKKKASKEASGKIKDSYIQESISYLEKSLLVTNKSFPEDFFYNDRIRYKLSELKESIK